MSQDLEHSSYALHIESWQSTAHGLVLHEMVSTISGHSSPPNSAALCRVRLRNCTPVPQVREHSPQSLKSETLQWIGQWCSLHALRCVTAGQLAPLWAACVVTERVRSFRPPPQPTVQSP